MWKRDSPSKSVALTSPFYLFRQARRLQKPARLTHHFPDRFLVIPFATTRQMSERDGASTGILYLIPPPDPRRRDPLTRVPVMVR